MSTDMAGRHVCLRLVPTARLELAQLSPLPPQDSVSTNSTTSAGKDQNNSIYFSAYSSGACNFQPVFTVEIRGAALRPPRNEVSARARQSTGRLLAGRSGLGRLVCRG